MSAPEKLATFARLRVRGFVTTTLDARLASVLVPADLKDRPGLIVNLDHAKGRGAWADERGVSEDLRFDGVWVPCWFPWEAIYLLSADGETVPFLDSVPIEIAGAAHRRALGMLEEAQAGATRAQNRPGWAGLTAVPPAPLLEFKASATDRVAEHGPCLLLAEDGLGCRLPTGHPPPCVSLDELIEEPAPKARGGLRVIKGGAS